MHRHEPLGLVLDLLDDHRRAAGHDRDARQVFLVLGLRHRQRVDVVAAAGEQSDDARQHARLVVDEHTERVALDSLRGRRGGIMGGAGSVRHHTITLPSSVTASSMSSAPPPSNISLWARPDGIIGKQFSLGSTTQSKITGRLTAIISLIAASRSPGFEQRMPTAWKPSASLTKSGSASV